ncbi:MAG: hypothetical protein V4515_06720 [Chloroflexota bacterium]
MDVAGNLAQSIGQGIVGLVGGALRALGAAAQGIVHALQSILPGPWLPIVAVAVMVLFVWNVFKR